MTDQYTEYLHHNIVVSSVIQPHTVICWEGGGSSGFVLLYLVSASIVVKLSIPMTIF